MAIIMASGKCRSYAALFLLLSYAYLFHTGKGWTDDDIAIGCIQLNTACLTLNFLWQLQLKHLLKLYRDLKKYGLCRIFVCILTLAAMASFIFVGGEAIVLKIWSVVSEEITLRFEDNIISIDEDREFYQKVLIHPATKGEKSPKLLYQLYRYPMEDVKLKCSFEMLWLADGSPFSDQVVWHRNGVPLTFTDRHSHKVNFRELPNGHSFKRSIFKQFGLSEYEINATLQISLLRDSEFGSYTCHIARFVKQTLLDFASNYERMNKFPGYKTKEKTQKEKENVKKPRSPCPCMCSHSLEPKYLFQDMFRWIGEFRLIKLTRRKEIIRAPPGSILSFTTSHYHFSRKDEVEIDYSVNSQPFTELCSDAFHGCSKLLMMYWLISHDTGNRFGLPPLSLHTIWENPAFFSERYRQVHCLCEHSYGHHAVKYLRRYYNRTSQQYELVEITHPHTLLVVPRRQTLLNLYVNRSVNDPLPHTHVPTSRLCDNKGSLNLNDLIMDLAFESVAYFYWTENAFIFVAALCCTYLAWKYLQYMRYLGTDIKYMVLNGAMGYLTSAAISTRKVKDDAITNDCESIPSNDIFLSYSDAKADIKLMSDGVVPFLEQQGYKVFSKDRDLPPNLQELPALSQAIESSKKFILFLTADYLEDKFRRDFEAAIIIESLCDKDTEAHQILVVRMGSCDVPLWLSHLQVHDWTTNLTFEEHSLRLLQWLVPRENGSKWLSKLDVFITFLPLQLIFAVFVVFMSFSFIV